jgi:L-lactate permease
MIVHADITVLTFLVDTLIPFLVAFLVKRFANERVKSGITAVAALLVAVIQEAIGSDGNFNVPALVGKFATALVAAYLAHQFVWKPAGLTGDSGVIAKALPFGLGRKDPALVAAAQQTRTAA